MDDLADLVEVVSRYKIGQIEILANPKPKGNLTKFDELYLAIRDGRVSSDEEAAQLLYHQQNSRYGPYVKLKNRLKYRLINTLFFIDQNQPHFSDREQAYYTCSKNWLAVSTLIARGARRPAITIAEKTIRMTIKFELTELTVHLAQELCRHYSLVQANTKKYRYYDEILQTSLNTLSAEIEAERYYTNVMQSFTQSQESKRQALIDEALLNSQHLLETYHEIESLRFIRMSYLLHVVSRQISFNYDSAIDLCQQALRKLSSKPYNSKSALFSFHLRLLSCHVQLMNYNEGERTAQDSLKSVQEGSHDWYAILFYYFTLCTYSKNYLKAYEIVQTAITHDTFKGFYANQKQLWLVNEAFIHFLIQTGKIDISQSTFPESKPFRLYKFLNEIPIYSKDKRGINISILIVHVLIMLQQRQHSRIIDRVDALNQYCHRYLRKDDTFRANCFIKMLLQMPRADFNKMRTERYAEKYYQKLLSKPLNIAEQGIEVEVLPYEHLWEIVKELLD